MRFSQKELEKYERKLIDLKKQILHVIKDVKEQVKEQEPQGYSQHQADEGTDDFERMMNLELTSKEFSILKQIDRALEKIKDGTYGICDISNEEIPKKRLDAIPYAIMTVKAQEELEKGL